MARTGRAASSCVFCTATRHTSKCPPVGMASSVRTCVVVCLPESKNPSILAQVELGLPNEAIGEALAISGGTVKWHLGNGFGKLGVRNRTRAVTVARELGYL